MITRGETMTPAEFFWDRVKHEENLFTSRANFFLVGESMLLAAVAALFSSDSAQGALFILCGVGAISTGIWMFVNYLQRKRTWNPARDSLKKLAADNPNDTGIASSFAAMQIVSDTGRLRRLKSHVLMGYVVPVLLLIGWLSLALEIPFRRPTAAGMITPERVALVFLLTLLILMAVWFERRMRRLESELTALRGGAPQAQPPTH